jgi:hypothetical protein
LASLHTSFGRTPLAALGGHGRVASAEPWCKRAAIRPGENRRERHHGARAHDWRIDMTTGIAAEKRTVSEADEVRTFEKGKLELVNIGGGLVGRLTLEPGWRWLLR